MGQLGIGEKIESIKEPIAVLLSEKIVKISSGWSHNVAISGSYPIKKRKNK